MSAKNRYFCNVSQQVLSEVVGTFRPTSRKKIGEGSLVKLIPLGVKMNLNQAQKGRLIFS